MYNIEEIPKREGASETKILIVYASKNGVTRRCAEMLSETLLNNSTFDVELHDLASGVPSVTDDDVLILGTSVRMGKLLRPMADWLRDHGEENASRTVGFFLCCGYTDMATTYYRKRVPAAVRERAVFEYFGGELKPEKLHGLDRWVVRTVRDQIRNENEEDENLGEYARVLPEILPDNIERFASQVKTRCKERNTNP